MVFAEHSIFGGFEFGRVGDDAVKADGVKWLMAVAKVEFGNNLRVMGDNPWMMIKATNIGAST